MGRCSRSWLTFRLYLSPNVSQRMKGPLYLTLLLWIPYPHSAFHSAYIGALSRILLYFGSLFILELQQLHVIFVVGARFPPHSITSLRYDRSCASNHPVHGCADTQGTILRSAQVSSPSSLRTLTLRRSVLRSTMSTSSGRKRTRAKLKWVDETERGFSSLSNGAQRSGSAPTHFLLAVSARDCRSASFSSSQCSDSKLTPCDHGLSTPATFSCSSSPGQLSAATSSSWCGWIEPGEGRRRPATSQGERDEKNAVRRRCQSKRFVGLSEELLAAGVSKVSSKCWLAGCFGLTRRCRVPERRSCRRFEGKYHTIAPRVNDLGSLS